MFYPSSSEAQQEQRMACIGIPSLMRRTIVEKDALLESYDVITQ